MTTELGTGPTPGVPGHIPTVRTVLVPANVWRVGLTARRPGRAALRELRARRRRVVIFTVVMAWFLSLAMEPAVSRPPGCGGAWRPWWSWSPSVCSPSGSSSPSGACSSSRRHELLRGLPTIVEAVLGWANDTWGTNYRSGDILASISLSPEDVAVYAQDVLGGILGLAASVAGAIFSLLRDHPADLLPVRGRSETAAVAGLLMPPQPQRLFLSVWDLSLEKTGGYVAARVVLATIGASSSAIVFLIIGMPSWLALGIWTGLVAQFVPTIGTYIAIALPVLVGLASPEPWIGVAALGWAVLYQQVENLTLEPRISARAVHLHPGVAFASVMLGASLFGAAGRCWPSRSRPCCSPSSTPTSSARTSSRLVTGEAADPDVREGRCGHGDRSDSIAGGEHGERRGRAPSLNVPGPCRTVRHVARMRHRITRESPTSRDRLGPVTVAHPVSWPRPVGDTHGGRPHVLAHRHRQPR